MKKCNDTGCSWYKGGTNIKYGPSRINRDQLNFSDYDESGYARRKQYFELSFEYEFEYDHDEVYFAYSVPYTYSMISHLVT